MVDQSVVRQWRPRGVIITAALFSAVFIAGAAIGWFALPPDIRALFQAFQILTLLGILAVILALLWFLACSSVRADEDGLTVRNAWQKRRLVWSQIRAIVLRPGDPWAVAVLHEKQDSGEPRTVLLFGLQGSEGAATRTAVAELNARIELNARTELNARIRDQQV